MNIWTPGLYLGWLLKEHILEVSLILFVAILGVIIVTELWPGERGER